MIEVANHNPITGGTHTMSMDIARDVFDDGIRKWSNEGMLIQDAFPTLSADEREFIMTGYTPEMWEEAFGSEE